MKCLMRPAWLAARRYFVFSASSSFSLPVITLFKLSARFGLSAYFVTLSSARRWAVSRAWSAGTATSGFTPSVRWVSSLKSLTIADRLLHLFCHVPIDVDLADLLQQSVDDSRPFGPVDGPVDSLAI